VGDEDGINEGLDAGSTESEGLDDSKDDVAEVESVGTGHGGEGGEGERGSDLVRFLLGLVLGGNDGSDGGDGSWVKNIFVSIIYI